MRSQESVKRFLTGARNDIIGSDNLRGKVYFSTYTVVIQKGVRFKAGITLMAGGRSLETRKSQERMRGDSPVIQREAEGRAKNLAR